MLAGGRYAWQSYVPYLQGWAKLLLERCARDAWSAGVRCTVFDAPEIWTNSSALFLGVEVPLYALLGALRPGGAGLGGGRTRSGRAAGRCSRTGATLEALLARAEEFLTAPALAPFRDFETWPQHTTREQLEAMLAASEALGAMSADPKDPVAAELSRAVVQGVGRLMFDASWEPAGPVRSLGHDVVARSLVANER